MRTRLSHVVVPCLLLAACVDQVRQDAPTAPATPLRSAEASAENNIGPSAIGAPIPIGLDVVASGLVSPVQLVQPNKLEMLFVVDQIGLVRMMHEDGPLLPQPFLDVRSLITPLNPGYDERGLLGLAFHPDFRKNGRFFVFYTAAPRVTGYDHTNVIAEFRATVGPRAMPQVIAGSERIVLQVDHPQGNHNGGTLAFGPDGYLYISIGDGGNRDDVGLGHVEDWYAGNAGGNAQDITQNLLGNILRIDVDRGAPYAIPLDNPFVGRPGLDEIFAYGFRNPYRFSFDTKGARSLLVGDAGQELWEEVSVVQRGGNYAWNVKEGTHCFDAEAPTVVPTTCPTVDPTTGAPLRNPVIEFPNSKNSAFGGDLGLTVVGGVVYRGNDVHALRRHYIFGSAATLALPGGSGRLFASNMEGSPLWRMRELRVNGTAPVGFVVKGFGIDRKGEVYVTASLILGPSGTTGTVLRIAAPTS